MGRPAKVVVALAIVVVAVAVLVWRLTTGDAARDIGVRLDLVEKGPFRVLLGGPLWRDRTLRDAGGARDVAYVTRDEPLLVEIVGRDANRPATLELDIDGRAAVRRRLCAPGHCPAAARATLTPPLRPGPLGSRRLTLVVHPESGATVTRTTFEVTVGDRLPTIREGEVLARRATPVAPAPLDAATRQRTLAVIASARRTGALRSVLGSAPYTVRQLGTLNHAGRAFGTTALIALPNPRKGVRARVPAYAADPQAPGGRRPAVVVLSAPVLRDLLVDVDVAGGRVIAVEPGPDSKTNRWQQTLLPLPAGAPPRPPPPPRGRDED